jgi:hypothetical protein
MKYSVERAGALMALTALGVASGHDVDTAASRAHETLSAWISSHRTLVAPYEEWLELMRTVAAPPA